MFFVIFCNMICLELIWLYCVEPSIPDYFLYKIIKAILLDSDFVLNKKKRSDRKLTMKCNFLPIRLCFINVYTYPKPKPTPYNYAKIVIIVVV